MSTLRKKVFSGAPVKCVFVYGSNNSDSIIFGNTAFGEIKDYSLNRIDFFKNVLTMTFFFRDLSSVKGVWLSK